MGEQIITQLKIEKDQLKWTYQGFITRNGKPFFIWTRKCNSTETYQVLKLDDDIKAIVFHDEDQIRCEYAFVNNFLVRHKAYTDMLEVYQLRFKQGELEVGSLVDQFTKVKKIKIVEFLKDSKKVSMQAVSSHS